MSSAVLAERGEVADVDEHHGHLATLTGDDLVPLLQQPRRQDGVDVGAECRLKSLPLSQSGLHAVERRRQRTEVVVLHHRQPVTVVAGRDPLGSFGEVAYGSQGRRERGAHREWYCHTNRHGAPDCHRERRTAPGHVERGCGWRAPGK